MRIFLDFETYYDRTYSLTKLSPVEYILDPRWETLCCAVAIEHEPAFLLPQDEVQHFLRTIKTTYSVITHNALFDACILAYHYSYSPHCLVLHAKHVRGRCTTRDPQREIIPQKPSKVSRPHREKRFLSTHMVGQALGRYRC